MAQTKTMKFNNSKADKAVSVIENYFATHKLNESTDAMIEQSITAMKEYTATLEKKEALLNKLLEKYSKEELLNLLL
jgi:hypothetical protein